MWWWGGVKGFWESSTNGQIVINFTGYYPRDPDDLWPDVFPNITSYMNISIYNHTGSLLVQNFTQVNISNKEIASAMTLGYNGFQSGILLPEMDNLTRVKELALQEAGGGVPGTVNLYESGLTLKITYEADGGTQQTYLIYEKWTGLLLWANSSAFSYHMICSLQNYSLWFYEEIPPSPPPEDLSPIKDSPKGYDDFMTLLSLINIIFFSAIGFTAVGLKSEKFKVKHILMGIIGTGLFTSLIFFSYGIFPFLHPEVELPQENVENIVLIVNYGDGNIDRWDNINLTEGNTTILDALNLKCDIVYKIYGDQDFFITGINGYLFGEKNWFYGVNGEAKLIAFNKYNLEDDDVINWFFGAKYEPP
jgi:hypothetical protein